MHITEAYPFSFDLVTASRAVLFAIGDGAEWWTLLLGHEQREKDPDLTRATSRDPYHGLS